MSPIVNTLLALGLTSGLMSAVSGAPTEDNVFRLTMSAVDAFPKAVGNLSTFDIDVNYIGYNSSVQSWLQSLNPSTASTDDEKARILTEAAYARSFDENDADMAADHAALLAAVDGNMQPADDAGFALSKRATNRFVTSAAHAVIWHTCAAAFSCLVGVTCKKSITVNHAPRDECRAVGGQNCCVSWSDYDVKYGFFQRTYSECNSAVNDQHLTKASCEGYGETAGGDVCLSNRAKHCT